MERREINLTYDSLVFNYVILLSFSLLADRNNFDRHSFFFLILFAGGDDRGRVYGRVGITGEKWHETRQGNREDEFGPQGYGNDVQNSSQTERTIETSDRHAFW